MQANRYVMNNIMLVIRSRLFLLGNKKAARRRLQKTTDLEVIYFSIDL